VSDLNSISDQITALADRFSLDAIYFFGSRASEVAAFVRGQGHLDPTTTSDVDAAVLPQLGHQLGVRDKVRLAAELEDLLDVGRVDLVVLPEADPFLAVDVVAGACIFARDPNALAEYELYVLRRAGDLAPFERARRRQLLEKTPYDLWTNQ
jgi:predicted nucleotidyltransferase